MDPRLVGCDTGVLINKVQTGFRQVKEAFRHCIDKIQTQSIHGHNNVKKRPKLIHTQYTVHGLDTDTMVQSQSKHVQDTNGVDMLQTQFRHSPDTFQTHPDTF